MKKNTKALEEGQVLTEEQSVDWAVDNINTEIQRRIREFFKWDRDVAEYSLGIDNKNGYVVLTWTKEGEENIVDKFKA